MTSLRSPVAAVERGSPGSSPSVRALLHCLRHRRKVSIELTGDGRRVTVLRLFVLVVLAKAEIPDKRAVQAVARNLPAGFPVVSARLMQHRRRLDNILRDLKRLGLLVREERDRKVCFVVTDAVEAVLDRCTANDSGDSSD